MTTSPLAGAQRTDDRPVEDLTTRARIRDAAMAEFAEHGYRGATMRGIAAAADVSLGLVQHHFGTKDGLRAACDERVLDLIRLKTDALDEGRLADPDVLASLMAMAPSVQRYVGKALVDGSPRMAELVERVCQANEDFLVSWWPDRFSPDTRRTRDAGAVMVAINTATMVMQDLVADRMGVEPYSATALERIGMALFDAFESYADFVASDTWAELRAGIAAPGGHPTDDHPANDDDPADHDAAADSHPGGNHADPDDNEE